MGAIADAIVEYGRPLLDQTDGSQEQMSKACALTQFCFNLALLPDESREDAINDFRSRTEMDDDVHATAAGSTSFAVEQQKDADSRGLKSTLLACDYFVSNGESLGLVSGGWKAAWSVNVRLGNPPETNPNSNSPQDTACNQKPPYNRERHRSRSPDIENLNS